MIRRLSRCIREYKWAALLSPLCMVGEVAMEVTIPLVMADLYDYGIAMSNMAVVWQKALQLLLCALAWTLLQALHMVTRLRPRRCAPWVHPLVWALFGLWLAFLVVSVALPTAGVMLPRLYGGRAATAALFFLLGALLWLTQPDAGP